MDSKIKLALAIGLVLLLAGCIGPMAENHEDYTAKEVIDQMEHDMEDVQSYEVEEELYAEFDANMMSMSFSAESESIIDVENNEFYRQGTESEFTGDSEFEEYYVDGDLYEHQQDGFEDLYEHQQDGFEDSWTVEENASAEASEVEEDFLEGLLEEETISELDVEVESDAFVLTGDFDDNVLDLLEDDEFTDLDENDTNEDEVEVNEFTIEFIIDRDDYLLDSFELYADMEMEMEDMTDETTTMQIIMDVSAEYSAYNDPVNIELPDEAEDADVQSGWSLDDGFDDEFDDGLDDEPRVDVSLTEKNETVDVEVKSVSEEVENMSIDISEEGSGWLETDGSHEINATAGETLELSEGTDYEDGAIIEVVVVDDEGMVWYPDYITVGEDDRDYDF